MSILTPLNPAAQLQRGQEYLERASECILALKGRSNLLPQTKLSELLESHQKTVDTFRSVIEGPDAKKLQACRACKHQARELFLAAKRAEREAILHDVASMHIAADMTDVPAQDDDSVEENQPFTLLEQWHPGHAQLSAVDEVT